ncbi:MAG: hypothetical protein MJ247_04660 [Alphaproteobacteria bacterium]|nr:hypothetical protein [Alphaproteobacteria bacterium]
MKFNLFIFLTTSFLSLPSFAQTRMPSNYENLKMYKMINECADVDSMEVCQKIISKHLEKYKALENELLEKYCKPQGLSEKECAEKILKDANFDKRLKEYMQNNANYPTILNNEAELQ